MLYFGLSITIFMYITILALILLYLGLIIFKKYFMANFLLSICFLHFLFSILILSWALILMNEGFDIILLSLDYTLVIIYCFIVGLILLIFDFKIKYIIYNKSFIKKLYRFLLPILTIALFILASILTYFNLNYFIFLTMW